MTRAVERRPADHQAGLPFQDHALTEQREVVRVLTHHRVDDHPIAGQTLLDDARRQRRALHALLLTNFAGALFALGHHHHVLGRFDVQLLALQSSRSPWWADRTDHRRTVRACRRSAVQRAAARAAIVAGPDAGAPAWLGAAR